MKRRLISLNNNKIVYDFNRKSIVVYDGRNQSILTGSFDYKTELKHHAEQILIKRIADDHYLAKFPANSPELAIEFQTKTNRRNDAITCNTFEWKLKHPKIRTHVQDFEECFNLDNYYWFGQAESEFQQYWPINNVSYAQIHKPYLTGQFESNSAVLERYWLCSAGVAIIVDQEVPLFVLKNETNICFLASDNLPYRNHHNLTLKYDICSIDSRSFKIDYLNKLHLYVINNYFAKPNGLPDKRMLRSPIWSTWAVFKKKIDQRVVLEFAQEIIQNNYTHSQLEIDDK